MPEYVGEVIRLNGAMENIVPAESGIEKLAGGLGFTEGPVWRREGYLVFSDIPNRAIMKWSPEDGVAVFRQPMGFTGEGNPPGELPGPNGMTLDAEGRLIVCEHGNRRLARLEEDGAVTVLADRFEGKRLNSPNDVVGKSDASYYFTDPPYGLAGKEDDPARELSCNGVYRLSPDGNLQMLFDGVKRPNGLAFSPDERYFYLANSDADRRIWLRFPVQEDGSLGKSDVFYDVTGHPDAGNPDGLKVDRTGNLYCTGPGGVWIFSPDGKHLGTIKPPEIPANLHWGDAGAKTLYITARTGLYRIRMGIQGIRP
jgi:gluconolactonase